MDSIFASLSGLFSIEGILGFILGAFAEYAFLKTRCWYLNKKHSEGIPRTVKIKKSYFVWALIFIIMGGIAYKNDKTYNQLVSCSKEFNAAIKARGDINTEQNDINYRWQVATYNRTMNLGGMLREYGSTADPRYVKKKTPIDLEYADTVSKIFEDQRAVAEKRAQIPYPEPTCGA